MSREWMSHVTQTSRRYDESCHANEWVMWHRHQDQWWKMRRWTKNNSSTSICSCLPVCPPEPYLLAQTPYSLSKEPCTLSKEPCILSKEPCVLSKESSILHIELQITRHIELYTQILCACVRVWGCRCGCGYGGGCGLSRHYKTHRITNYKTHRSTYTDIASVYVILCVL